MKTTMFTAARKSASICAICCFSVWVVASTLNADAVDFNWMVLLIPILLVTALGLGRIILGLVYLGRCRREATPIVPLPDRVGALQRRLGSTISETGVVEDLEVLKSPDETLSAAAVDAVHQWRFKPAQCDGEDVGVYYNLTVKFSLK